MNKLPLKTILIFIFILAGAVNAQFVSSSSPRSYAMGGGAEGLCDDALSIVDNLATMGRYADYPGQIVVSFGTSKFWDYELEGWVAPDNAAFMRFQRLVLAPSRKAESTQYAIWLNTISPALSWVGVATDNRSTYKIATYSMIKEVGFGFGINLSESFHLGLGAGLGLPFTESKLWNLTTGDKNKITEIGLYMIPIGHIDFEYFILPELNLAVNSIISGLFASEGTPDDIQNSSGKYFAGSGMLQVSASLALELSPFLHLSGGYKIAKINPPSYADVDMNKFSHNCSLGAEYLIMLKGAFSQLAIRAGVFVENMFGTTNSSADIYQQIKRGLRFGIAVKLNKLIFEMSASVILQDGRLSFNREPAYISVGYLF